MLTIVQDKKKLTSDSYNFDMTCLWDKYISGYK